MLARRFLIVFAIAATASGVNAAVPAAAAGSGESATSVPATVAPASETTDAGVAALDAYATSAGWSSAPGPGRTAGGADTQDLFGLVEPAGGGFPCLDLFADHLTDDGALVGEVARTLSPTYLPAQIDSTEPRWMVQPFTFVEGAALVVEQASVGDAKALIDTFGDQATATCVAEGMEALIAQSDVPSPDIEVVATSLEIGDQAAHLSLTVTEGEGDEAATVERSTYVARRGSTVVLLLVVTTQPGTGDFDPAAALAAMLDGADGSDRAATSVAASTTG